MGTVIVMPTFCEVCGKPIPRPSKRRTYCSEACACKGHKEKVAIAHEEKRLMMREYAEIKKGTRAKKPSPLSKKMMWDAIIQGMEETGLTYGEYIARLDGFK